jgi:hypothetical protein
MFNISKCLFWFNFGFSCHNGRCILTRFNVESFISLTSLYCLYWKYCFQTLLLSSIVVPLILRLYFNKDKCCFTLYKLSLMFSWVWHQINHHYVMKAILLIYHNLHCTKKSTSYWSRVDTLHNYHIYITS